MGELSGWLVDDYIVPPDQPQENLNLWRVLLDYIPGLEFVGGVPYPELADYVESQPNRPDYIIRNGTYFRRLNIDVPTMAFFQDNALTNLVIRADQYQVAATSAVSVFNSPFLRSEYEAIAYCAATAIIPAPVDFTTFRPMVASELRKKWDIKPKSVCWVGANNVWKGFDRLVWLIEEYPEIEFVVVRKDKGNELRKYPNVREFTRIDHLDLAQVMNCCHMGLSTSSMESQHLGLLEMGACGLPVVATNFGAFLGRYPGAWGMTVETRGEIPHCLKVGLSQDHDRWAIRDYWSRECFDVLDVVGAWRRCIGAVTGSST